jgi:hypothetical protein
MIPLGMFCDVQTNSNRFTDSNPNEVPKPQTLIFKGDAHETIPVSSAVVENDSGFDCGQKANQAEPGHYGRAQTISMAWKPETDGETASWILLCSDASHS